MEHTNVGQLQARLIVAELIRCGVNRFCLSPGSRNTPLLLAAAENRAALTESFIDERGAAFFALGLAKATGEPAVLICTSGTAVANYLPAVIEASQSATPLIVISADRPAELRDTGANQTIDQVKIFGEYTRWFHDLPTPTSAMEPGSVLTLIDRMVAAATGVPAGPVHLNCQFTEPLTPERDGSVTADLLVPISGWLESREPITPPLAGTDPPTSDELAQLKSLLSESRSGVIVAGQLDGDPGNARILELAAGLKMPLLADISSGLRFTGGDRSRLVTHYDHYLGDEAFRGELTPDLVIRLGGPLVSKNLNRYLESGPGSRVRVDLTPFNSGSGYDVDLRLKLPPAAFCKLCVPTEERIESTLSAGFRRGEQISARILESTLPSRSLTNELAIPWGLLRDLPADTAVFLGNSMPVRDADSCGVTLDHPVRVGVNRGASGIDGTLATALGFARGLARPTLLLLGDLALIHDLNSLALLARSTTPMAVVVINNDGGGIFSHLPIASYPEHFEGCFGTPHGLTFTELAAALKIPHHRPETPAELRGVTAEVLVSSGCSLIEIRTERQSNAREHRELRQLVERALSEAAS